MVPCQYEAATNTCQSCKVLARVCTFTPISQLISGFVGREVDPRNYLGDNKSKFLVHGEGKIRGLVPFDGIDMKDKFKATRIPEPNGWQTLYADIEAGEAVDDEADDDDGAADLDDDEED